LSPSRTARLALVALVAGLLPLLVLLLLAFAQELTESACERDSLALWFGFCQTSGPLALVWRFVEVLTRPATVVTILLGAALAALLAWGLGDYTAGRLCATGQARRRAFARMGKWLGALSFAVLAALGALFFIHGSTSMQMVSSM
jgi:hypothetical protein